MKQSRDWNFQLEWKPQDLWFGMFWKRCGNCIDLWICIVPMLPLHFSFWGERWGMKEVEV